MRATRVSGDSPCSTKCSPPPGRSTRYASASARPGSGIVHSVQVLITKSAQASATGSDWASVPMNSTATT